MRRISVLMICMSVVTTCLSAADVPSPGVGWTEVMGGSWSPDAVVLSKAESALRKALAARRGHKVTAADWQTYSFQYQGNTTPVGHKVIEVNAFCSTLPDEWRTHFDLTREWLRVFGGGDCFFRAHYDSTTGAVSSFKINAPK